MNIVVLVVSGLITAALLAVGVWWKKRNEPKHVFLARDLEVGSVQPKRIKNIYGPFKVKINKKVIHFPVPTGFGQQRMDGKGLIFEGDINTGQLIKPDAEGRSYDFAHGIFLEKALSDGRVQQITASSKGIGGVTLQHVLIAVGVVGILVVVVIYQFARAHTGG
jgi:hypothetical protein